MLSAILAARRWDGDLREIKPRLDLLGNLRKLLPFHLSSCLRRRCEAYFAQYCKVLGKVQVKVSMELLLLLMFYFSLPVN